MHSRDGVVPVSLPPLEGIRGPASSLFLLLPSDAQLKSTTLLVQVVVVIVHKTDDPFDPRRPPGVQNYGSTPVLSLSTIVCNCTVSRY